MATAAVDYPVRFDVEYPERLSRWKPFVKWLLALPHYVILYLISGANIWVAAALTILFRRRYPGWWFDFQVKLLQYQYRVCGYGLLLFRDEYPALEEEQAIRLEVDQPEDLNRWLPLVKWILAIPHFLILLALFAVAIIFVILAWFAILFTGRYPRGLFDFVVGANRWGLRVMAYAFFMFTDRYPPFSMH